MPRCQMPRVLCATKTRDIWRIIMHRLWTSWEWMPNVRWGPWRRTFGIQGQNISEPRLNKGLKDHSRKHLEGEHVSFGIIWPSRLTSLWIFSYVSLEENLKSFVVLGMGWVYNVMLKRSLFSCSLVGIKVERLLVLNQVLWKLIDLISFYNFSFLIFFIHCIIKYNHKFLDLFIPC